MFDPERFARGDRKYVREIVDEYSPMVLMVCQAYTRDLDHAEDLFQETWRTAWTRVDSYRAEGSFRSWLHQVAVNVCRTDSRAQKRREEVREEAAVELDQSWTYVDPLHESARRELQRAILRALPELTPGEREAVTLRVLEGRKPAEVARIMGVSPATVRSHVRHALNHLRRIMEDPDHELSRYRSSS